MSKINKKMSKSDIKLIKSAHTKYITKNFGKYVNSTVNGHYFMRSVKDGINFYCKNYELSKKIFNDKECYEGMKNDFNKLELLTENGDLELLDTKPVVYKKPTYTPTSELPPPPSEWLEESDTEDEVIAFSLEEDNELALKVVSEKPDNSVPRISQFYWDYTEDALDYKQDIKPYLKKSYCGRIGDYFVDYNFIKKISKYYEINEKKLKKLMKINNPDFKYLRLSWNKKFTTLKIDYIKKTEELKSDKWKDKTKKYFMNYWETISCPLKESVWYNPDYIPMTLKKLN